MIPELNAREARAADIPVISVARLSDPDAEVRDTQARALRAACVGPGFFHVRDHGVQRRVVDDLFDQARRYFDLPLSEKMRLEAHTSPVFRGYTPLLAENADVAAGGDVHEAFDIGGVLYDGTDGEDLNRYPSALPALEPALKAYRAHMLRLAETLMGGFALALDLPVDHFAPDLTNPQAFLRVLHYPPQSGEIDPGQIGIGAHSDYESLTILAQDDNRALQISDGRGGWIWADPMPGCFIVNIGDQMALWTNDIFRSTVPRAINVGGRRRYSIPFFYGPNPDTVIETLPGCAGPARAALYDPIRAGDYSRQRNAQSYLKPAL